MIIKVTALKWVTVNDPVGIETVSEFGNPIIQMQPGEYREFDVLDQQGLRLIPPLDRAQTAGMLLYEVVFTSGGFITVEDEGVLVEPACSVLNIVGDDVVAINMGSGRVDVQHGASAYSPPLGTGLGALAWPPTSPGYISRPEGGPGSPYYAGGWDIQNNNHPRITTSTANLFKTINGALGYTHTSPRVTNLHAGQIDVAITDGSGATDSVTLVLSPTGGDQDAVSTLGYLKIAIRDTLTIGPVVEGKVYIYADIPGMLAVVATGTGGYLKLEVNHTVAPTDSDFGEAFWDDGVLPNASLNPVVTPNAPVVKWLSGIRYFDIGSTFDVVDTPGGVLDGVNMTINNDGFVFYNDASEFNAVVNDVLYNALSIAGLNYSPLLSPLRTDKPRYAETIIVGAGDFGDLDARVHTTWDNFHGNEAGSPKTSNAGIFQIWTYVTSTPTIEFFEDEAYRLQDADFTNYKQDAGDYRRWWGSGVGTDLRNWDSQESIDTGTTGHIEGLQFYGGFLDYPVIDFSTGYYFADFDYSVCIANRDFYRAFNVGDLLNHKKFVLTLQVDGLDETNFKINGGGDDSTTVRVDIMFPGPEKAVPIGSNNPTFPGSGWLHCGKLFNAPTFKGIDNDGVLQTMRLVGSTLTITVVTGNMSSFYSDGTIMMRVRYKDTVPGKIGQITVEGV